MPKPLELQDWYTLWAPAYDAVVQMPFAPVRALSLKTLADKPPSRVLVDGIGTGLDVPFMPIHHQYVGIDITAAMLKQAAIRKNGRNLNLLRTNCQRLPFPDASFDHAILHLILAVVPDPVQALKEAARVVKPGGTVLVMDKFLRKGQFVPPFALINPLMSRIVTRLDLVFEDVVAQVPEFRVTSDLPVLLWGWVRNIQLVRV
jgi:ubiquinone/menaquinone biosynthesis C-methylase UbiE